MTPNIESPHEMRNYLLHEFMHLTKHEFMTHDFMVFRPTMFADRRSVENNAHIPEIDLSAP